MKMPSSGSHPTFETLSAYADQPDVAAAGTRAGRHVARCAECATTVTEIRALGESARGVELAGPSDELWSRIEAERRLRPTFTAHPPSPVVARRHRAIHLAGAMLAAAMLLGAVVLAVGLPTLSASPASRLTVIPAHPVPGTRVQVRFTPSPKMTSYDHVVLVGAFARGDGELRTDYFSGGLYDSLAVLRRVDGTMVGEFTLPPDALAAALVVESPDGVVYEGDAGFSWIVVSGDAAGRPSLASLLAAQAFQGLHGRAAQARILDTLQRYYPDHPAGYATARRYDGRNVFGTLLEFFNGAERKYASFDARLEGAPGLDASREAAMIDFAYQIEEPREAAKWTERLVRDHPGDRRAVGYYATMLHQLELAGMPADSIRQRIPALDALLTRAAPATGRGLAAGFELIPRYASDSVQRRWALMVARAGQQSVFPRLSVADRWLADAEVRDATKRQLLVAIARDCGAAGHHYARDLPYRDWRKACTSTRGSAFDQLSLVARVEGNPSAALAYSDSSIALSAADCGLAGGFPFRHRAEAHLALGDTAAAARDYAQLFWFNNGRRDAQLERDSVRRLVASAMDSAHFVRLIADAERDGLACHRRIREANKKAATR